MDDAVQQKAHRFEILQNAAYHAADRAWAGLLSFLTAQSVLVLAWAAIFQVKEIPARIGVLFWISLLGILLSFLWALLSTRMWTYHLGYVAKLNELAAAEKYLPEWLEVDRVVRAEWRGGDAEPNESWRESAERWLRRLSRPSANTRLMFSAPLLFSVLHVLMIYPVLSCPLSGEYVSQIRSSCWSIGNLQDTVADGFGGVLTLYVVLVGAIWVRCRRSIDGLFPDGPPDPSPAREDSK